jgi:hypothetical protein
MGTSNNSDEFKRKIEQGQHGSARGNGCHQCLQLAYSVRKYLGWADGT